MEAKLSDQPPVLRGRIVLSGIDQPGSLGILFEILEGAADRGAIEQTFKNVKELWRAGQQQVRNIHSNEACFNMNLWMYSLVEAWAWDQPQECISDRSASPWDSEPRRPSHNDKRKALQRNMMQAEIQAALSGPPNKERIQALAERLLELAV